MKKPKISLNSAKLQALFVQHVEKLLLVLVVGAMLFLVYQGFSMPGLEQGKTPQGLLQASQTTLQHINDPGRWSKIQDKREIKANVGDNVAKDQLPVDGNQYFLSMAWDKPNFPKLSPRTDPKLFAPIHLVVRPVIGPLACLRPEAYVDPLEPPPAEEGEEGGAPKKKAKPKAKPKPKNVAGLDGAMPAPGAGGGGRRGTRPPPSGGGDVFGMPESGMLDPNGGMADSMGLGGMPQAGQVVVNPEAIRGYHASDAEARNTQAVVVMAVVPYEKQVEEFQNALQNSLDHDAQRDSPLYLQYYVERADVTANPEAEEASLTWAPLGVNAAKDEIYNWAGAPTEIVDAA
jgi:hypothetical protein